MVFDSLTKPRKHRTLPAARYNSTTGFWHSPSTKGRGNTVMRKLTLFAVVALVLSTIALLTVRYGYAEEPPQHIATWTFVGYYPSGIALDPQGNLYANNFYGGNIVKMSPNGDVLQIIGSSGTGNGQFVNPEGLAIDQQGNLYVGDFGYFRVQKLSSSGSWLATWGDGSGSFQFFYTQGVAVDHQGFVYVVDDWHVRKLDPNSGEVLLTFGSQGSGNGQFSAPGGIAVASDGSIFVGDWDNSNVQKFTANGDFVVSWGGVGGEPGKFRNAQGVAVDQNDNVYVCDVNNDRIQKFDVNGNLLSYWYTGHPIFIALDHFGNLYVSSSSHNSISKFRYDLPVPTRTTSWGRLKALYR